MYIIPTGDRKSRFNEPIYGLTGSYSLSEGISIPYFTALMEIERAIAELSIAEDVPPSLSTQWSLKELFQREIDENRVRDEIIKGYLLDPQKLKFFNALTIVLMPKNHDGLVLDSFDESPYVEPPGIPWTGDDELDSQWATDNANQADFGGVQFTSLGISARLRWDKDSVLAVAVDGQHRLWSLSTFRNAPEFRNKTLKPNEKNTKIPVIFVLLHPDAGFENSQDTVEYTIRGIARELFTDLNKNAKKVDRARELVLDDSSINARCVRTLVTEKTAQDSEKLLPLSLVRWQDDSNRFDGKYFINSLVHLDLLVKDLLELKKDNIPDDPMDKTQVKKFITTINRCLGINGNEIQYDGRSLSRYYEEDCCDEDGEPLTPFSRLPSYYLNSAVEGFKANFRPWILKLLLEFKPYKELLIYARANNLIEGVFGSFYAQTKKHRNMILKEKTIQDTDWNTREVLRPEQEITSMKENQWAFKAIFQKAMVRLGRVIEFENPNDENLGNADTLIAFLDNLYDREVLKVDTPLPGNPFLLWTFIGLNSSNNKIKVTKTVENRIFCILSLWYYGARKIEIDLRSGTERPSNRQLLKFFSAHSSTAQWPDCKKAFDELYKCFNTTTLYGRDVEDLSEKQKDELVRSRLADVFGQGLPLSNDESLKQDVAED